MSSSANKLFDLSIGSDESPTSSNNSSKKNSPELTQEQKERIEKNRKRALDLRKKKEDAELERELEEEKATKIAKIVLSNSEQKKLLDSGAGFYLDEEEFQEEKKKETKIVEEPSVPNPEEHLKCERCNKKFPHSFLSLNFDLNVCDSCKVEFPDDYKLITKTDAKTEFLLKDFDFEEREPPLKFIAKRNPHKNSWGEMKLYLRCQCEKLAVNVHESLTNLEEKKEVKILNLHKTRQKNYEKKLKELRKEARQGAKKTVEFHKHEYGEEQHDSDNDTYFKICKTCSFRFEYEEL